MSVKYYRFFIFPGLTIISLILGVCGEYPQGGIGNIWWIFGLAGVIGVVWFVLNWAGMIGSITSMMEMLQKGDVDSETSYSCKNGLVNKLGGAFACRFKDQNSKINSLEAANKQFRLQLQLSEKQRHQTEAIIYSICDAVIVTDSFNRLILANDPARNILGFSDGSAESLPIEQLIKCRDFIELMRQVGQAGTAHVKRELKFSVGGEEKIFDCIISCIKDESDRFFGMVAVLHDVTREKEISQMKNDFVSHVSHELKTPLASITAYAEMLVDGEANDEDTRRQFYSVIQTQAARLNRLIENILNISRIESGLVKINKEPLSLAILVRDAVKMIQSYAAEKNITVTEKCSIVCDQVEADKDMMSQVIVNLLSNAVKYTPNGGSVTVSLEVDDSDNMVRVAVADTGVGIPESEISHLFEKFYRVAANNKCAKGTGLGLNLVKQIVEKTHNGRMFVKSKAGEGSTFGFELPLRVAAGVEVR